MNTTGRSADELRCPHCNHPIEVTGLLRERVEAQMRGAMEAELAQKLAEQAKRADAELAAVNARLAAATGKEAELLKLQRELDAREQQVKLDAERRISEEVARIRVAERKAADETAARAAQERERGYAEEIEAARLKLAEASSREVELLRNVRTAKEREEQLELEVARKVAAEAAQIREQSAKLTEERLGAEQAKQQLEAEQNRLRIDSLQRTIDELNRKVKQGSQQEQGEAQEVVLRDLLVEQFPLDAVDDVPKGINGADLLQRVVGLHDMPCGTIIWESKRTRAWSDGWLAKLRDDQRDVGATIAVIVTQVMPDGVRQFGQVDGVWVCDWSHAVVLAHVLRTGMIELALAHRAAEGRGEKMQMLYAYLTSVEFKNRVTGVMEAFHELQADLHSERTAMQARWRKREKQHQRALANMTALYGDLQGISGTRLETIPAFELEPAVALPAGADGDADGDADDSVEDHEANAAPRATRAIGSGAHGAARPEDPQLVDLLFSLLPEGGETVGNLTLSQRFIDEAFGRLGLAVTIEDFERCRGALLAAGRARRGKGRGGSIARTVSS